MTNSSFTWVQFECIFTRHKMLKFLGLLAVLLAPLPSLTEGKDYRHLSVQIFCFQFHCAMNKVGGINIFYKILSWALQNHKVLN